MNRHSKPLRPALLALSLILATASHASRADEVSSSEQRLRAGMQQLLLDMASKGELAAAPGAPLQFEINEPSREVDNLGVVIDGNDSRGPGLAIVAVTPGGAAARMGVRSGDRLIEVNSQSLGTPAAGATDASQAVATLRSAIATVGDGGKLSLVVDRDGRRIESSGVLNRLRLPAVHLRVGDGLQVASASAAADRLGCGRISTFDVAPRQQNLHRAILIAIDGKAAGPNSSTSFRLSTGRHVLTVAEAIEPRYLSFNDRQRNSGGSSHKDIEVDVKADTTYFLAAKLNVDQTHVWKDGAYWQPALWKESNERCNP